VHLGHAAATDHYANLVAITKGSHGLGHLTIMPDK